MQFASFSKDNSARSTNKITCRTDKHECPSHSPSDLHSFKESPSKEDEPIIFAQLIGEIEARTQRLFTEKLAPY